jgi:hypothetical protein
MLDEDLLYSTPETRMVDLECASGEAYSFGSVSCAIWQSGSYSSDDRGAIFGRQNDNEIHDT